MIIGITGTLGSGKGTIVAFLKKKGFVHYSSSDVLIRILNDRDLPVDREHLSSLANELMQEYEGGVLHFSHKYAVEANDQNYILEALHRVSEAEYIKKIGGTVIGVDADTEVRYKRIAKRKDGEKDKVTFEQFVADCNREEEGKIPGGPNIRAVMRMSDHIIKNSKSLLDLKKEIDNFLNKNHD
ncbi:MAG: dephospho-CoA kinase [Candidatus Paceibacteria bacterium]|jgi:dephospho-CoA kinase